MLAVRLLYLMADHLDVAPLWAKYRHDKIAQPISRYWATVGDSKIDLLFQLQKSAIIRREPTDDPSGRTK
jgi:hypothetical protein